METVAWYAVLKKVGSACACSGGSLYWDARMCVYVLSCALSPSLSCVSLGFGEFGARLLCCTPAPVYCTAVVLTLQSSGKPRVIIAHLRVSVSCEEL